MGPEAPRLDTHIQVEVVAQESEEGHAAVHRPLPLVCLLRRQPDVHVLRVGRGGERVLQPHTPAPASSAGATPLGSGPAPLTGPLRPALDPGHTHPGRGHAQYSHAPPLRPAPSARPCPPRTQASPTLGQGSAPSASTAAQVLPSLPLCPASPDPSAPDSPALSFPAQTLWGSWFLTRLATRTPFQNSAFLCTT